ncbi:cytidylate kinase [Paenibacillus cellulosilyticus]|uniref:Cytidylate kinase n=1 Tax=Paenibacillus cellulosilyticus TaxID=375489 RepID=A0A2V2YW40_9BACL|nr:(d)CMP kinase [Paenibacillus cellulosilyticus]PWW05571.1 cytidylate kinase [Paenibacillus cellulosilyticus]QKS45393.1 (d)CMP kinase [Paenibacillus cellulosilyticus]
MVLHPDGDRDRINIAIDGPAGAGKSTVARKVAETLNYIYIDTGAMYRAVTLSALRNGISIDDKEMLSVHAENIVITLMPGAAGQVVLLNGEDVTTDIRSREVTLHVSQVSAVERVRLRLVAMQRQLAQSKGVVMDGRDIGSHVLPNAELKIFLTASVEERALRRFKELNGRDSISLEQLEREIAERDRKDQEREISPLVCAPDAIVLDSTSMTIDEVADNIVNLSRTKLAEAK